MKTYEVTSPDGKVYEVTAPEGATQEQIFSFAQQQLSQPKPAPSTASVAVNAANKAITAVPDAFLNAPTNVWNLGKAAFGTAATALGRPDLAPDLTPTPNLARKLYEKLGYIRESSEPQTTGQRILDSTVQGAVGGALGGANSIPGVLANIGLGATGGLAGQSTKELTGSDSLGLAATLLTPMVAESAATAAQDKLSKLATQQRQNAPRDQALKAGQAEGYVVPPATAEPTLTNKVLESIAGKAATQQDASIKNVEVTDALARRAIGLPPDTPLTPQATRQVRAEAYQQGYEPIKQAGTITTGRLYRQALDDIESQYSGASRSFGGVPEEVKKLVDGLRVRFFDAGDALDMTQVLRDNASKAFRNGDTSLGQANRAAAKALEDQIERNLSGQVLENFRDARQLMAKSHTVEDAIMADTGHVDARKIAAELQKGAPLSGDLKTIGAFANNFKKDVQPPQQVGSPGVSKVAALASGGFGFGGAALGGPAGALAGAIPLVAPPLARSMLLSKGYQAGLQPNYNPAMATALSQATPQFFTPLQFAEELRRRGQ